MTQRARGSFLVLFTLGAVLAVLGAAHVRAQSTAQSVWDGVYTEDQAKRGEAEANANCQVCHGERMSGDMGPGLAGDDFLGAWAGKPAFELFEKIRTTMPQGNEGSLSSRGVADLVAYIFQLNKFPAGQTELGTSAAALGRILIQKTK